MRILLSALYPFLFLLLYLSIPFDEYLRAFPNVLLIILALAFPFVVKKRDFKNLQNAPFILFLALGLYSLGNGFFHERLDDDFAITSRILLAIGMVVLSIPIRDINKIKEAIIYSSLAAILFSVFNFVLISHHTGTFQLGDSPQVVEALLIDRTYLALVCVLSILFSFQGLKKTYHPLNRYYIANIILNLIFVFLISSKIAVVALLSLALLRQMFGNRSVLKLVLGFTFAMLAMAVIYLVQNKNDLLHSQKLPPAISHFILESRTYETRAAIWTCAAEVVRKTENVIFGYGFKHSEEMLIDCYQHHKNNPLSAAFIKDRYHSHNQFIDFYLSAGLIALVLFLGLFFGLIKLTYSHYYTVALVMLLIFYSLLENLFHRQMGAYYFSAILIVILHHINSRTIAKEEKLVKE